MNIGILGAGRMAEKMVKTIQQMSDMSAYAIASRSIKKAYLFSKQYNVKVFYGSYEELLLDNNVDLVYIALPHNFHYEWVLKAINAHKNILCEKTFAINYKQAVEMVNLAKRKGVLLAEAMWTRYMPSRNLINELVSSGIIGQIKSVIANLGYPVSWKDRLLQPGLAGGALFELTVYPINFVAMILGTDIKSIEAHCIKTPSGVDSQDFVSMEFADGITACFFTTIFSLTNRTGVISGEKGFIEIENINNPQRICVYQRDWHKNKLIRVVDIPKQISGYEYELNACKKAICDGQIECNEMTHTDILEIMKIVDEIKYKCGLSYLKDE